MTLRAARESIRREIPLKSMLIPTSVPMTHSVLDGHVLQIMTARIRVMIPSNSSQREPGMGRSRNDKIARVPGKHQMSRPTENKQPGDQ